MCYSFPPPFFLSVVYRWFGSHRFPPFFLSVVYRWFGSQMGQTKDYKIVLAASPPSREYRAVWGKTGYLKISGYCAVRYYCLVCVLIYEWSISNLFAFVVVLFCYFVFVFVRFLFVCLFVVFVLFFVCTFFFILCPLSNVAHVSGLSMLDCSCGCQ